MDMLATETWYQVKGTTITPVTINKVTPNGWLHCTTHDGVELKIRRRPNHDGFIMFCDFTIAVAEAIRNAIMTKATDNYHELAHNIIQLTCERQLRAIND